MYYNTQYNLVELYTRFNNSANISKRITDTNILNLQFRLVIKNDIKTYYQMLSKEWYIDLYCSMDWYSYKQEMSRLFTSYWLVLINLKIKKHVLKLELLISLSRHFSETIYNAPDFIFERDYINLKKYTLNNLTTKQCNNRILKKKHILLLIKKSKSLLYNYFRYTWKKKYSNNNISLKKKILLNDLNKKHFHSLQLDNTKKVSTNSSISNIYLLYNEKNIQKKKNWIQNFYHNMFQYKINIFVKKIYDTSILNSFFLKNSLWYPIRTCINNSNIDIYFYKMLKNKYHMFFDIELSNYVDNAMNLSYYYRLYRLLSSAEHPNMYLQSDLYAIYLYRTLNRLKPQTIASSKWQIKKNISNLYINSNILIEYYISSKYLIHKYINLILDYVLNDVTLETLSRWIRWSISFRSLHAKKTKQLVMEWTIHELRSKEKQPLDINVRIKNPSLIELYQYRTVQELCKQRGHFEAYVSQTIQSYKRLGYPANMDLNFKSKLNPISIQPVTKLKTNPLFEDTSSLDISIHDYRWVLYFLYQDIHIKKFINFLIKKGKKFKALQIFYNVLTILKEITSISPIYIIKSIFASNQKMFFFDSKEIKKKTKIKILFYKWKKRAMTPYHSFFAELKDLYITDYISISEKIAYLLITNLIEFSGQQLEIEAVETVEKVLKHKYILLRKTKKNIYNKKIRSRYSRYKANKDLILNYKKKF